MSACTSSGDTKVILAALLDTKLTVSHQEQELYQRNTQWQYLYDIYNVNR